MRLLKRLKQNLANIPGWRTKRRFVVIESDDWGGIRVSSRDAFKHFLKKGYPVDECPYNSNDMLESQTDLAMLFEVLSSVKDRNGHPAMITANQIMANPDFDRIQSNDFQKYYYEPFEKTLQRYPDHNKVIDLYRAGFDNKIFFPQFHGREHVNVSRWIKSLGSGDKVARDVFDQQMFSVHPSRKPSYVNEYMDALNFSSPAEKAFIELTVVDGLNLFKEFWGFSSSSFIAPSYIWSKDLESVLHRSDVQYIQGIIAQFEPRFTEDHRYKVRMHYQGQKNKNGQRYLVRNAFFEPALFPNDDSVDNCMQRISTAFKWRKPAIIASHRVNFIGGINELNRARNLKSLSRLLNNIVKTWPDAEFISSADLGMYMDNLN
jgi:hypothetical protein